MGTARSSPSSVARAKTQGGLHIQDKARLFKVLKTPVPLQQLPAELQAVIGYEFFKVDPESGRVRELDEIFGPEAERDFWLKLDDLAHDMCDLLQLLERNERSGRRSRGNRDHLPRRDDQRSSRTARRHPA